MTANQADVYRERIDEPALSKVWLNKVEIACYDLVLRR